MAVSSESLLRTTGGISLMLFGFGLNRILNKSEVFNSFDNCGRTNINFALSGSVLTGALLTYNGVRLIR